MKIFDIFENMKKGFFSVLEHLTTHSHIAIEKKSATHKPHTVIDDRSGFKLKKTIFDELFMDGGVFSDKQKDSIGTDDTFAEFVGDVEDNEELRSLVVKRILATALSLQPEAQPSSSSVMTSSGSKPTAQVSSVGVNRSENFLTAMDGTIRQALYQWREEGKVGDENTGRLFTAAEKALGGGYTDIIFRAMVDQIQGQKGLDCDNLNAQDASYIINIIFNEVKIDTNQDEQIKQVLDNIKQQIIVNFTARQDFLTIMRNVCNDIKKNHGRATTLGRAAAAAGHLAEVKRPAPERPIRLNSKFS